jgi:preprotein translocase subunit SecF
MIVASKEPRFDFLGRTRLFVGLSAVVVAGGSALVTARGIPYGVEFSGGTQMVAQFQSEPDIERVRAALQPVAPGSVIQSYGSPAANRVLIRMAGAGDHELESDARAALRALAAAYSNNPVKDSSTEIVGPVAGTELRALAVRLTAIGLACQFLYIGLRFKGMIWGAGATVAVLHDVLVTLALLVACGYEITLNVIAALLTLVGYSVNDTIVIFDRARELIPQAPKAPMARIMNEALNQTLGRTLISNGTTFLAVLGLFLFGGEPLRGFAFCMVVGVLAGTYSTIYIASPIVVWWRMAHPRGRGPGHRAGHAEEASNAP